MHRKVIVNSISYTGWKLVGVIPYSIFTTRMADIKQFVLVVSLLMAMMLEFINQVVSVRISSPIMKLNNSVNKNEEAAFMITQLAKLFRISLSKGHTIISIRDELQHAQSYMNIQKIRYKNKFEVVFDIDPEILDHCVVKLVLQPILENAINYGMREMDGCGIINICGKKVDDRIILSVSDNGMGIPDDEIGFLLKDTNRIRKRGSGVGLVNVNNRIKILFGGQYGLYIISKDNMETVNDEIDVINQEIKNGADAVVVKR